VTADRRAVERILANLVDNALTALAAVPARPEGPAGPGGAPSGREAPEPSSRPVRPASLPGRVTDARRGHVWLEARAALPADPAGGVLLIVTDDGPGFAPGLAERAFDRFVRGDPARTGPGSGLGLAIVRDLALAHGGAVSAENVAPQGARLTVQLPRVPLAATGVGGPGGHDASRPDGLPAPYEG
jgi:signal transduction histidine kinase